MPSWARRLRLIAYIDGDPREILRMRPSLDRGATRRWCKASSRSQRPEAIDDTDLTDTCPPRGAVHAACLPGMSIVAAQELAIAPRVASCISTRCTASWIGFAYAVWVHDRFQRSLSVAPDSGVLEDLGTRRAFEEPFLAGRHPVSNPEGDEKEAPYPLPFHPLDSERPRCST
jgi:hypothetical protein